MTASAQVLYSSRVARPLFQRRGLSIRAYKRPRRKGSGPVRIGKSSSAPSSTLGVLIIGTSSDIHNYPYTAFQRVGQ